MDIREILVEGAGELGLELGSEQVESFMVYMAELRRWNEKVNLTAVTGEREIVVRHFLDSLAAVGPVCGGVGGAEGLKLLDMGAGGGLPGLALKIVLPELELTLMDSVSKKVSFLRHVIRTLELAGAEAVWGRAEDEALIEQLGGGFDIIISRAFSNISTFLSLAEPYLAPGGRVVAIKGPSGEELSAEIEATGKAAMGALFALEDTVEKKVPFSDRRTTFLTYRRKGEN